MIAFGGIVGASIWYGTVRSPCFPDPVPAVLLISTCSLPSMDKLLQTGTLTPAFSFAGFGHRLQRSCWRVDQLHNHRRGRILCDAEPRRDVYAVPGAGRFH